MSVRLYSILSSRKPWVASVLLSVFMILPNSHSALAACDSTKVFRAEAEITYKKKGFSSTPPAEALEQSRQAAIENAFKKYPESCMEAGAMQLYLQKKDEILSNLDEFVNITYEDQAVDKKNRKIKTRIKLTVNSKTLDSMFVATPAATAGGGSGRPSFMVWIFAAKMATSTTGGSSGGGSVKTFKKKETDIAKTKTADAAMETSSSQGGTMATASQTESMAQVTTGGSVEKKDDIVIGNTSTSSTREWQIVSTKSLDAAFGDQLTLNNFRPVPYAAAVNKCGGEEPEIAASELALDGELSRETLNAITNALQGCRIEFLALGTVDVNTPQQSTVNRGEFDSYLKVNAKVIDLRDFLPYDLATVPTFDIRASGLEDNEATENALQLAGKSAAKEIVSRLKANGIR